MPLTAFLQPQAFRPQAGLVFPTWEYSSPQAALNALNNAGGGTLMFPGSQSAQPVNLTLNTANTATRLVGQGANQGGTVLSSADGVNPPVQLGANAKQIAIEDIFLQSPATPNAIGSALYVNAGTANVPTLWMKNVTFATAGAGSTCPGLWFHSGSMVEGFNVQLSDLGGAGTAGILMDSVNAGQLYLTNLMGTGGWANILNVTAGSDIRIVNADLFGPRVNGVQIAPTTGVTAFCSFTNVTVDFTGVQTGVPWAIGGGAGSVQKITLTNCWANGPQSQNGFNLHSGAGSIIVARLIACGAVGNNAGAANGVDVSGTVVDLHIADGTFTNFGGTAGSGVFINGAGIQNWACIGNNVGGNFTAGIDVAPFATDHYVVLGNYGGGANTVLDGGTGTNKYVIAGGAGTTINPP